MHVVLFHSALGRRQVEHTLADALRRDGHHVSVPDLYGGRTADTLEDGLALKDTVGWPAIRDRGRQALRSAPADAVLVGVSMGAGVVSEMWPDRPQTPAVLLIHGHAVVPDEVAADGVRAALHVAVDDPFAPAGTVADWRSTAQARGIEAEVQLYPGVGHFFSDPASPAYDRPSADLLLVRARRFLQEL